MKPFYVLLALFTFLLVLVGVAQFYNPLPGLTGVPHPEIKGMMISSGNTDQFEHLRWLGYFFALGVVGVFGCIYFIGNLKKRSDYRYWEVVDRFYNMLCFDLHGYDFFKLELCAKC